MPLGAAAGLEDSPSKGMLTGRGIVLSEQAAEGDLGRRHKGPRVSQKGPSPTWLVSASRSLPSDSSFTVNVIIYDYVLWPSIALCI